MPKTSNSKGTKAETLVKASKKGAIELSESDLKKVSGGLKLSHKAD